MSLDIMFYEKDILICECGRKHELGTNSVYTGNITHNLTEMAEQAEIYKCLWRPNENGFKVAKDLIKSLEKGLKLLKESPNFYKKFNSPNGWGVYKDFVPFVEEVLCACKKHPNAIVETDR